MAERTEIDALITRVRSLPDAAKFEVYEVLRNDLTLVLTRETPATQEIRERKEALDALTAAAEELKLKPREAPTVKQFDKASKRLSLNWSSAKVIRAWGTWRLATMAYQGERSTTQGALKKRSQAASRDLSDQEVIDGLRKWLKTKPAQPTMVSYDAFVDEFNAKVSSNKKALLRSKTIQRRYLLTWKNIITVAEKKMTLRQAEEQEKAERVQRKPGDTLVGTRAAAIFLGLKIRRVGYLRETDTNFPTPVAHIRDFPAWLLGDFRLYKRSLPTPDRIEDEQQEQYMDALELGSRLGLPNRKIKESLRDKRWDLLPQPTGYLGITIPYWKRDRAEKWLKDHGYKP